MTIINKNIFAIFSLVAAMSLPSAAYSESINYNRNYWISLTNTTDYTVTISDIENYARYGTVIDDDTVVDRIEGTIEPGKSKRGRIRLLDKTQYSEILFKASFTVHNDQTDKDDTKTCHYWISFKTADGTLAGITASRYAGDPLPSCSFAKNGNDTYSFFIGTSNDHPSAD